MVVWSVWLFHFISRSSWSPRGCNSGGNYRHHSNTFLESWGRQSQPYLPLQPTSTQSIFSWLADCKNRWEKLSNGTSRLFKTPAHHNNNHQQLQEQILLREQWQIKSTDFFFLFSFPPYYLATTLKGQHKDTCHDASVNKQKALAYILQSVSFQEYHSAKNLAVISDILDPWCLSCLMPILYDKVHLPLRHCMWASDFWVTYTFLYCLQFQM